MGTSTVPPGGIVTDVVAGVIAAPAVAACGWISIVQAPPPVPASLSESSRALRAAAFDVSR